MCDVRMRSHSWLELFYVGRNPWAYSPLYLPLSHIPTSQYHVAAVCAPAAYTITALYRLFQRKFGPDVSKFIASFIVGDRRDYSDYPCLIGDAPNRFACPCPHHTPRRTP
jgi:hypothetical protein